MPKKFAQFGVSAAKIFLAMMREIPRGITSSFFPPKYARKYGYSNLYKHYHSTTNRLLKRGLIRKTDRTFRLTAKGEREALFAFLDTEIVNFHPHTPSKWDGGWRIVFFDVPEKKRRHRDFLRRVLKGVGFKEFQKSVWIYPHPVPSFLRDLLFEENIKQFTRFVTTDHIEYDADLRKLFPETFFKKSA